MSAWAARYVGTPYDDAHCWELVRRVFRDLRGIALPSYGEIDARDLAAVARGMASAQTRDPWAVVDSPREFDIVLLRGRARVWHVGVMVDATGILHTERATNAVLVQRLDPAISGRVTGFRRWLG
jgi:cell wall-associated NlpC family hydrolase